MIKAGIKVGPHDWLKRLQKSHARYCEVWFRVDRPHWYTQMFSWLQKKGVHTGLHFWAILEGNIEANVAYPGKTLATSLKLVIAAIDMAAQHKFHYVNIHCGNRRLTRANLEKQIFIPIPGTEIPLTQAEATLEKSWAKLHQYARQKDVQLLVETLPARTGTGSLLKPQARLKPVNQYSLPVKSLIKLAREHSLLVTNDFCHTFADEFDQPLESLSQALVEKTRALAPHTKLLHLNSVIPPYNGTDTHHGITDEDFLIPGIFPTKQKLIELLKIFKFRNDVWAINEPSHRHTENYQALTIILQSL